MVRNDGEEILCCGNEGDREEDERRGDVKVEYVPVKEKDGFSTYKEAEKWARRSAEGKHTMWESTGREDEEGRRKAQLP
ncbi:hypothetical protein DRO30_00910 [Candidatus Bathyarchaeota archaeon]|nr:MAG: hypothetical protein DRO30_00910 [Candidatus Bathyarchaeota archaeon]